MSFSALYGFPYNRRRLRQNNQPLKTNVQSDWFAPTITLDCFIKDKIQKPTFWISLLYLCDIAGAFCPCNFLGVALYLKSSTLFLNLRTEKSKHGIANGNNFFFNHALFKIFDRRYKKSLFEISIISMTYEINYLKRQNEQIFLVTWFNIYIPSIDYLLVSSARDWLAIISLIFTI